VSFDVPPPAGSGTGAILRALGTLMAALGGEEIPPGARPAAPVSRYAPPQYAEPRYPEARHEAPYPEYSDTQYTPPSFEAPQYRAPEDEPPRAAPRGEGGAAFEAQLLLTEARERAERILQESMQRAQDLITRERAAAPGAPAAVPGSEEIAPLRRSVDDLLLSMRDVQARLGRIESILNATRTGEATPPAPPARSTFTAPEEERRPGVLSVVAPQAPARPSAPLPVTPPSVQPAAEGAPPTPAPMAPSPAPSPMRGGSQPAAAHAHAEASEPAAAAWQRRTAEDEGVAGTLATFTPADGSVVLRAAPVSGFQGLMRLQDALQRIPSVRQATVEAYSQGEARLRLELSSDVDSDEIAEGVGAGLGQNAQVREASEPDRTIVIAFG